MCKCGPDVFPEFEYCGRCHPAVDRKKYLDADELKARFESKTCATEIKEATRVLKAGELVYASDVKDVPEKDEGNELLHAFILVNDAMKDLPVDKARKVLKAVSILLGLDERHY